MKKYIVYKHQKKTGFAIPMSDKIYFKAKNIPRDK